MRPWRRSRTGRPRWPLRSSCVRADLPEQGEQEQAQAALGSHLPLDARVRRFAALPYLPAAEDVDAGQHPEH